VRVNQRVQIPAPLAAEFHQCRPRALDDLELVERLQLAQKVHHFRMHNARVVPVIVEA
jgi:hypothetical protein